MTNIRDVERKEDLIKLLEDSDITVTMFNNAVDKYKAIIKLLNDNGMDTHIYPQGSFSIGTVVKPLRKNKDADYDLDVICEVQIAKSEISASSLYARIKGIFENDGHYKDKIKLFPECIRINYADCGGYKFSMDVVPSVPEEKTAILKMKSVSKEPNLCETAIAITTLENGILGWGDSNPQGYTQWFLNISDDFLNYESGVNTNKFSLYERNKTVFSSADEIPKQIIRTPVQRVVQLLKLHCKAYFSNPNVETYSVKSVIIATIVANSAKYADKSMDTFELLSYVLQDLKIYEELKSNHALFRIRHSGKEIIKFANNEWIIENPTNPFDNLANSWNDDTKYVTYFFKWIDAALKDFSCISAEEHYPFRTTISKLFGESTIKRMGYDNKYHIPAPTPITATGQNKPWLNI